jgi:hypothetical protein
VKGLILDIETLAYRDWLVGEDVDVFATVTMKQAIRRKTPKGVVFEPLTKGIVEKTAWVIRDRITKRVLGSAKYRAGLRLRFIPMCEGNGGDKRLHLHVCTQKPYDMSFDEYELKFRKSIKDLEWLREIVEVRPLDSKYAAITYTLKEGFDAFLPKAFHPGE